MFQKKKISTGSKNRWNGQIIEISHSLGFPCGSDGKESACNTGDQSLIPGSGRSPGEGNGTHYKILAWRSPGEGNGYRLQYSGLENSMDCIVRGVAKSQTVTKRVSHYSHSVNWIRFYEPSLEPQPNPAHCLSGEGSSPIWICTVKNETEAEIEATQSLFNCQRMEVNHKSTSCPKGFFLINYF